MKIKNLVELLGQLDQEADARYLVISRDEDGVVVAMSADIKENDIKLIKGAFNDTNSI